MQPEENSQNTSSPGESDGEITPQDLLKELGVDRLGKSLIEGTPPIEVDRQLLRHYYAKLLSEVEAELIEDLMANYQEWNDAGDEVLLELAIEQEQGSNFEQ